MKMKCDCEIRGCDASGESAYIVYCPLHKAAEKMLGILETAIEDADHAKAMNPGESDSEYVDAVELTKGEWYKQAKRLIAKVNPVMKRV